MLNWNKVREEFPAVKKMIYLNAAAGSPLPISAAEEGKKFYDEMMMYGDIPWFEWLERQENIRKKIAALIGAEPCEIAFTMNASHGMNLIADTLRKYKHVLTMKQEFPTTTIPWLHRGFNVDFVEPANSIYSIRNIEGKITAKTEILLTSYVQYCSGFRQDLESVGRLCRKRKLIYVVNATQGFGVLPIDVKKFNIDFLVSSSHKWPLAGYGVGIIYINKKWFGAINYPTAGWKSVNNSEQMVNTNLDIKKDATEYELGCMHFAPIFALGGAVDFLNSIGAKNIHKRILELGNYLIKKLQKLGLEVISPTDEKYRSGIIIVKLENANDIVSKLEEKKIYVSARGVGIRIAVHIYNNKSDIDELIRELKSILKK